MRDGLWRFAACLVVACADPAQQRPPPLTTASIEISEDIGSGGAGTATQTAPPLSALVRVCCPACTPDTRLSLRYRGSSAASDVAPVAVPGRSCAGTQFDLHGDLAAGDPTSARIEVTDAVTSIVATVPSDALAPRTLVGDAASFALCPGHSETLQWSPASDLPATPRSGQLDFVRPYQCSEGCLSQFVSFGADTTVDAAGLHFVVPDKTAPQGGVRGVVTVALPEYRDPGQPALTCEGAASCTYHRFVVAQHAASYAMNCP